MYQHIDLEPDTVKRGTHYAPCLRRSDTGDIVAEGMPCYGHWLDALSAAEDAFELQQRNGGSWLKACSAAMN